MYIFRKEKGSKINNLKFLPQEVVTEKQIKPKVNKRKKRFEQKSMKLKTGNQQRKSIEPKGDSLKIS